MRETADLILRAGVPEDWRSLYHNLWSRDEAFTFMFKHACGEEAAQAKTALYAMMHREVPTEFFVCEKASGQVIGIAGMKQLTPSRFTITDIALGPDHWRKGYGQQILSALLELAVQLGAAEVLYSCFAENEASRRLAERCGFLFEREEPAEVQKDGRNVTLCIYQKVIS